MLSPVLCSVELLDKLKDSGVGCYMGCEFVGFVCYADHLIVIVSSFTICSSNPVLHKYMV